MGGPSKGGASNNEHPSTAYDQEIEEALFSLDRQKNNIQEEEQQHLRELTGQSDGWKYCYMYFHYLFNPINFLFL